MQANRTPAAAEPRSPARALLAARRKLRSALATLEHERPSAVDVRNAHVMVSGAAAALDEHLVARAALNAQEQRSHARALARTLRDARGRRRTAVTMPGYRRGQSPVTKGVAFQKTPPTINETVRMLALVPTLRKVERGECPSCHRTWRQPHSQECINPYAERMKALIYLLWRCGLRIGCEALRLTENDLYPADGYLYVAEGKNSEAGEVAVDDWRWPLLAPWLEFRQAYPPGPLFCVMEGPTAGVRPWCGPSVRLNLRDLAKRAGVRHRVHPHAWRHAMALEQRDEGYDTLVISRNLRHKNIGTTHIYFEGFPQSRVIAELRARPMPKVSMLDALRNQGVAVSEHHQAARTTAPDLMGVLARA